MSIRKNVLVAGILGFAVGASALGFVAVANPAGSPDFPADSDSATFNFGQEGINAHGESFGPLESYDNPPDLFEAAATNNKIGYIRWSEFWAQIKPADSLQDALATTGRQTTYVLQVYESDGETVIGEYVGTSGGQ